MPANWSRKLTPAIYVRDGAALRDLRGVRAYMLSLSDGQLSRSQWLRAGGLLIAAAENGGGLQEVRRRVMLALLLCGHLDLVRTQPEEPPPHWPDR